MPTIQIPEAFEFLYEGESRYRAAYGGRGSGKSHAFAQALIVRGVQRPTRWLCCREIQLSLKASVRQLLVDKIKATGFERHYADSTDTEIRGRNGTLITFAGLRTNPDSVKSTEGLDGAWIEEASTVSQRSIDLLIPTLRKPGSEIWATWNPRRKDDPIDALLRGVELPPRAIVRRVNWDDNPWFPEVLREEMLYDRRRDPDKYAHIWLGEYQRNSEARVFRNWRVEEFETPERTTFHFGADWGFAVDPSVLVRCWVDGRTLYVDHEAYRVGCEIDDTPALFAGTDKSPTPRWPNRFGYEGVPGAAKWQIIGDSARPETISYLRRHGFNITPAVKGPGSVEEGIEFLRRFNIVVHPRCRHTIDELTLYSFKRDPLTEQVLPVLEDKKNHVIDALRYAVEPLRRAPMQISEEALAWARRRA